MSAAQNSERTFIFVADTSFGYFILNIKAQIFQPTYSINILPKSKIFK
jgi:hypothetical protein